MPAPTPTLYKPAHDSPARDCCAFRATHPHLAERVGAAANGDPAGAHPLGERAKRAAEIPEMPETPIP